MTAYDRIGTAYAQRRRPDPRIARAIGDALAGAASVINVGAGAGSYEPRGPSVVAVEPAITMINQRSPDAAPVVRARAEAVPFGDGAFDAALAVLTIHHWSDWRAGLNELARVARRRVVLFTWDPTSDGSWVGQDYFPEMVAMDRARFPDLRALEGALGRIDVRRVPIPADCTDGFFGAYWRRPEALLDPAIRRSISSLAQGSYVASLDRLAADLQSGAWARQYAHLMGLTELDAGYCLVVADRAG